MNEEDMMSKYAVEEDRPTSKTASVDIRCPLCGRKCEKHGSIVLCPYHGSEPFERR